MGICLFFLPHLPHPPHLPHLPYPQSPIPDQQNLPRNGKSPEQLSISFPTQYSGLSSLDKFYRLICRGEIFSCNLYCLDKTAGRLLFGRNQHHHISAFFFRCLLHFSKRL